MKLPYLRKLRKVRFDRYLLRKLAAKSEQAVGGFIHRNILGKQRHLIEGVVISRFIERKKRKRKKYRLGPELFFDLEFYSLQTKEKFNSIGDAIAHYEHNAARGKHLKPHPLFDPAYYLAQLKNKNLGGLSPLTHYLQHMNDFDAVPTPYFDARFYLQSYPDVKTAGVNPFVHYMQYGRGELRKPHALIDPAFYLLNNRELSAANSDPVSHYLMHYAAKSKQGIHPLIDGALILDQVKSLGLPAGAREPLLLYLNYGAKHRINPHPLFDSDYYRFVVSSQKLEPPHPGETLLAHFLRVFSPERPLDPSTAFSSELYLQRNRDIGDLNPLYHYVRFGRSERRPLSAAVLDLTDPDFQPIIGLEPTILAPHQNEANMFSTIYPNFHHPGSSLVRGVLDDLAGFCPDTVFLFSAFRRGGAERVNLKLVQTMLDLEPDRKILIVLTDRAANEAAHWCPVHPNLRTTAFTHESELPLPETVTMLARLLELLRPYQVINCNSKIGWEAYRDYGMPLSGITKLRASLFCYDYDKFGRKVGYARDYIRDTIAHLDLVYIDNKRFIDDLAHDFSLSRSEKAKLRILYQPVSAGKAGDVSERWPDLAKTLQQPRLLWPMRFHRQKRPDLFRELALKLPAVKFDAWVPGGSWDAAVAHGPKPANIAMLSDTKQKFADLDVSHYCGLLSTSQWEGLPTIILEGVVAGLPIVGSDVGGLAEAVSCRTAYVVSPFDDVADYESAIGELLADPAAAGRKRQLAYRHVMAQHDQRAYERSLRQMSILQTGKKHAGKN